MYPTPKGDRILLGAERQLYEESLGMMADLLAEINRSRQQPLKELSMGMSHDYRIAIEEGATLLRIGTSIFGPRSASSAGRL